MRIEGYISQIKFRSDNNSYTVMIVEDEEGEEYTLVGEVEGVSEGLYITAETEASVHPIYDEQFKIKNYEISMPVEVDAIEHYLASGAIRGIGQVLARMIVKRFKEDTLRIMEQEPERLAEIKGISEKKAQDFGVQFRESIGIRQAMLFLGKYGVTARIAVKIYREYGNRLYQVIEENPYKIAEDVPGVGFKIADSIAQHAGISYDSEYRIDAAIQYTLSQIGSLGHMYLPYAMLVRKVNSFLLSREEAAAGYAGMEPEIERRISAMQIERQLVVLESAEGQIVYGKMQYYTEQKVARLCLDLNLKYDIKDEEIRKRLMKIHTEGSVVLDEEQREAVYTAVRSGLFIITGGPGTGKTTIINTIIRYFESEGLNICLAAPTGRAAKRMTEATGYQAQTIHRLLEVTGMSESGSMFDRDENNPLEADVVIIDEVSMVDIYLAKALLSAIVPGTHLILVGDVNQLPSVGPGNVLRDMIQTEIFPVTRLNTVYRQEEGSDIVSNAHKINRGVYPSMDNKSRDFFVLARKTPEAILEEVGKLVAEKMPRYVQAKPTEIQVLTPMKRGELGVDALNEMLQAYLNPPSPNKQEYKAHDTIFREGDKVMQIRNNYKLDWQLVSEKGGFVREEGTGVFNGDLGIVKEINRFAEEVVVVFDEEKVVKYAFAMLEELELAYAVTIHKSQGSEYPAVILPLLNGPRVLFHRNLLYTAVTRAKKCVIIVGNPGKVCEMVDNVEEQKRYSGLTRAIIEQRQENDTRID